MSTEMFLMVNAMSKYFLMVNAILRAQQLAPIGNYVVIGGFGPPPEIPMAAKNRSSKKNRSSRSRAAKLSKRQKRKSFF
jgi:hypothetical protein